MAVSADLPFHAELPHENAVLRALNGQRGHLFHWTPVGLAIGIGGYFALRFEPVLAHYVLLVCIVMVAAMLGRFVMRPFAPFCWLLGLVAMGALLAGARAHYVAGPVLDFRYYGSIEGRIVAIDRSFSDKLRLTLDRVVLERMDPRRVPDRVRISLHGEAHFQPEPGLRIMTTGHLSPLQGPVEPGGFDFRRMGWFQGLGAVGYTRNPALVVAPAKHGAAGLRIHRLRMAVSGYVQQALPGRSGAFAAAVTTGDRSGMDQDTIQALRVTNLAHLLAISGLHMGLLTGFVFAAIRFGLCLVPWLALRVPVKKVGAVVALVAGAFYYAMSGGNIATERAFIMVSVMFVAVLLDRRAITLRAVAIAALIVLGLRPEALLSPGFQMSFAATTALVAVFGAMRDWPGPRPPRWAGPIVALVVSSSVAGLATAPVAAAHFNRFADYGLIANLLSVPLMGTIVMPGAVLAAVLAPFGLAWLGLAVMKPGIDWILWVADWVAGFEGASSGIMSPGAWVLPILSLGALWVVLWQGHARWAGVVPVICAFALWGTAERPILLVSDSGGLMGVLTQHGRALSKERGDGFAARTWLENDGDLAARENTAARPGFLVDGPMVQARLGRFTVTQLRGRGASEALPEACTRSDIVMINKDVEAPDKCRVFDARRLRDTGALAITPREDGLHIVSATQMAGQRLWLTGR